MNILHTNANGLYNKIYKLKSFLSDNYIDIICIAETHFIKDILDAEINIDGCIIKRKDRSLVLTMINSIVIVMVPLFIVEII